MKKSKSKTAELFPATETRVETPVREIKAVEPPQKHTPENTMKTETDQDPFVEIQTRKKQMEDAQQAAKHLIRKEFETLLQHINLIGKDILKEEALQPFLGELGVVNVTRVETEAPKRGRRSSGGKSVRELVEDVIKSASQPLTMSEVSKQVEATLGKKPSNVFTALKKMVEAKTAVKDKEGKYSKA